MEHKTCKFLVRGAVPPENSIFITSCTETAILENWLTQTCNQYHVGRIGLATACNTSITFDRFFLLTLSVYKAFKLFKDQCWPSK